MEFSSTIEGEGISINIFGRRRPFKILTARIDLREMCAESNVDFSDSENDISGNYYCVTLLQWEYNLFC